jgi:hypothetical protein
MSFERVYGIGWFCDFTHEFMEYMKTCSIYTLIGIYTDEENPISRKQIQYLKSYADHICIIPYSHRGLYLSAMISPKDTRQNACLLSKNKSFKCSHICIQTWQEIQPTKQKFLKDLYHVVPNVSSTTSTISIPYPEMKRKCSTSSDESTTKHLKSESGPSISEVDSISAQNVNMKPSYLSSKYPHPRDKSIRFEDKYQGLEHVYLVDWEGKNEFDTKRYKSASGFYKQYFPEFDSDGIISKMMASAKWSKSKYYGMSVQEIKDQWNKTGQDASAQGNAHHLKCEQYYNGIDLKEPYGKPIEQFLQFVNDHKHLKPFRTEWLLRSDIEHRICGTPDMLFVSNRQVVQKDAPKTLYLTLFDWKNSKAIKKYNMWEKGYAPFDDLPNCNYFHYAIQLNVYKYMIEQFYGRMEVDGVIYDKIEIDQMFLIVMHDNREKYLKLLLPNYQDRIKIIFDERADSLKSL